MEMALSSTATFASFLPTLKHKILIFPSPTVLRHKKLPEWQCDENFGRKNKGKPWHANRCSEMRPMQLQEPEEQRSSR